MKENGKDWLYLFYAWKPARIPVGEWDYRYKALRYIRKNITGKADWILR